MTHTLTLKIISLKETLYDGDVASVTLPTTTGEITVLPRHAPIIGLLTQGTVSVHSGSEIKKISVVSGSYKVHQHELLLLLN